MYFFFFKQKTAYEMRISDWSSDVCSSDLRRWRTDGTSLMNLLRSLGASAGISLCTTLLTQNTQTTHEHLTRFVTRSALDVIDPAQATRYGEIGGAALAAVNAELTRQIGRAHV